MKDIFSWNNIASTLMYGGIAFVLAKLGASLTSWEFWVTIGLVAGIELMAILKYMYR